MAYPKTLRNNLGLTHTAFADLIHCSPGQLSMAESGKRKLPPQSEEILAILEEAWANTANAEPFTIKPGKALDAWLSTHIRRKNQQLAGLKNTAALLEQKATQATRLLALAQWLETEHPLQQDSEAALKMKIIKKKSERKLQTIITSLAKKQIAIQAMEAQLAMAIKIKV